MPIPENAVTDVLEVLVAAGNVKDSEYLIENFVTTPTEHQRHLHVKVHLKVTPSGTLPTSALNVLHAYEQKALFAPMNTYSYCITTLLRSSSTLGRAQGWDLFTHMRYVAHPDPDVHLYTQMIQACADPLIKSRPSEPEKALDIWTEMTVDRRLEPTIRSYNAIILACAKSGEKVYVNEGYRLAKQMMDAFRDAKGVSAFGPNRKTLIALLQGAKRLRDLGRARWILAKIVRGVSYGLGEDIQTVLVNEEIMMHLFQTYACYRPPFSREATAIVQEEEGSAHVKEENSSTKAAEISSTVKIPVPFGAAMNQTSTDSNESPLILESIPSFSHLPPQSPEEVIREATYLFQRILYDAGIIPAPSEDDHYDPSSSSLVGKFSDVQLTPRLIASYMSISFRHAPMTLSETMFWTVYDQLKVPRTARVYVEALEACTRCPNRDVALKFSKDVWVKWQEVEDSGQDVSKALDARMTERAYTAMLHLYAK